MSNYPAGADSHPDAPWNQPDKQEWEVECMAIENNMVIIDLTWFPQGEELPTRVELFEDDIIELIENKLD